MNWWQAVLLAVLFMGGTLVVWLLLDWWERR